MTVSEHSKLRQLQKSQARAITHNTKQKEKRPKQKKKHSDAKTRDDNSVSKKYEKKRLSKEFANTLEKAEVIDLISKNYTEKLNNSGQKEIRF